MSARQQNSDCGWLHSLSDTQAHRSVSVIALIPRNATEAGVETLERDKPASCFPDSYTYNPDSPQPCAGVDMALARCPQILHEAQLLHANLPAGTAPSKGRQGRGQTPTAGQLMRAKSE